MPVRRIMLVVLSLMQTSPVLADGTPEFNRNYYGIWAGERMLCSAPAKRLHSYEQKGTRHPAIFQGAPGYSCKVRKVQGLWPHWKLDTTCISFGVGIRPETLRATQTLSLLEGGKVLRMQLLSERGEELWADDLHWCRPSKSRHPTKHIH